MTITLNYGRMDRPAQPRAADVKQDIASLIDAAYQQWSQVAQPSIPLLRETMEYDVHDGLYEEAVRLLAPHADALAGLNENNFPRITFPYEGGYVLTPTYFGNMRSGDVSGIFLTALLNLSNIAVLSGDFENEWLGYRLAAGKTIIAGEGSKIWRLGEKAEGRVVSKMAHELSSVEANLGQHAKGAEIINYGSIDLVGRWARDSTILNFGKAEALGRGAGRSLIFNAGSVVSEQKESRTTLTGACLAVNYGTWHMKPHSEALYIDNEVFINAGQIMSKVMFIQKGTLAVNVADTELAVTGTLAVYINCAPVKGNYADIPIFRERSQWKGAIIDARPLYMKPGLSRQKSKAREHVRAIESVARRIGDAGKLLKQDGGLEKFLAFDWQQAKAELLEHNKKLRVQL